ncbi:hypothetical protein NVV43_19035 [Escherichia marmotae]|uniref:Uncharacterized protein n=1 Tax=Escherichia marmotae TaxID=1499973 RepID=A0AAW5MXT3_9ESCH|nr:hypothetical protein [Escherichia marmotae]
MCSRHGFLLSTGKARAWSAVFWRRQPLRVCRRPGGQSAEQLMPASGTGGMMTGRKNAHRESWVNAL